MKLHEQNNSNLKKSIIKISFKSQIIPFNLYYLVSNDTNQTNLIYQ
jgi:hypothetical protein